MNKGNGTTEHKLWVAAPALAALAGFAYLWRRRDNEPTMPPGPAGWPVIGNLPLNDENRLPGFMNMFHEYGDIVGLRVGSRRLHIVNHPEYAKHVLLDSNRNYHKGRGLDKAKAILGNGLLTSEGAYWRRQRRLIQPAFHKRQIASLVETMSAATKAMLERWQALAENSVVDVSAEMTRLTLDIVSRCLFSTALTRSEFDTVAEIMGPMLRHATRRIAGLFDFMDELPLPANRRQEERIDALNRIVYRIIAERRQSSGEHTDLLGMLMSAGDGASDDRMSDEQVRDEVMTLFLAGHETTANLLAFTWATLSQQVSVRRQVQAEIDQLLKGQLPDAADLERLVYTNHTLLEVLRLYPPAWIIGRKPLTDDEIGGYIIPAGSTVLIAPYVIHRHPAFWANPEGFDPERFSETRNRERHRFAHIPFGGGPRLCIGNHFALMEATIVVAMVMQKFTLNLAPGRHLELETAFTLRPKNGVLMKLERRAEAGGEIYAEC